MTVQSIDEGASSKGIGISWANCLLGPKRRYVTQVAVKCTVR
jgi:hypothetical protein